MKTSIIKLFLFLLFITCGLYSCQSGNTDTGKNNPVQETTIKSDTSLEPGEVVLSQKQVDAMDIQFGTPEQRNLMDVVKANGYILLPPQARANVSPFIGGVVKTVYVIPGARVKKGQALATLESPDYIQLQEDYLKAKNDLIFLEKDYQRQKEMLSANATSEKMYQQTLNNYNSTKAMVLSLQNKLKLLGISVNNLDKGRMVSAISILSPINGYVQKVNINMGEFADPARSMFEIVNSDKLFIDLQVYQENLGQIKTGQKVLLSLPNQSQPIGEAAIYAIDNLLDSSTRSVNVHARIVKNEKSRLFPGVYVNGYIQTGANKVNALPSEAFYKEAETENVFILSRVITENNNKEYIFSSEEVRTGVSNAGFTAVTFLGNIPPDAKIVTKGTYYIVSEKNKGKGGDAD